MKLLKTIIISVLVVALLGFTFVFVLDAYNTGKIGDKAGKTAEEFTENLLGTWQGEHAISRITFKEDGKAVLTMLGIEIDAEYADSYNLETQIHTLKLKYNTSLGISVERYYKAERSEDTLTLIDSQFDSVALKYRKSDEKIDSSQKEEKTVYNPGVDVYAKELLGQWISSVSKNSGYEFKDNTSVYIKTLGVGTDGSYSLSIDETTNRCILKIKYISVAGVSISNSYYITIEEDILTLTQIGAENIQTTYKKTA